jgi:transcriptional accessory protein Tex/SPT6
LWIKDAKFSDKNHILGLKMHTCQHLVASRQLLQALRAVLLSCVAYTGVEINLAGMRPFYSNALPFVCGLGPYKSAMLLSRIKQQENALVDSRLQLADVPLFGLGEVVYRNCIGFLRVRSKLFDKHKFSRDVNHYDATRIHPENYDLANVVVSSCAGYRTEQGGGRDAKSAMDSDESESEPEEVGARHVCVRVFVFYSSMSILYIR